MTIRYRAYLGVILVGICASFILGFEVAMSHNEAVWDKTVYAYERSYASKAPKQIKVDKVPESEPETPTIAPQAVVEHKTGDCSLVYNYDWDTRTAMAVCLSESSNNPSAINWSDQHNGCKGSAGLFQIACIHTGGSHELNPERNVEIAYKLWKRSGWGIWGAYSSKAYLKYL